MLSGGRISRGDVPILRVQYNEAAGADLWRMLQFLESRMYRPLAGPCLGCLARGPDIFGAVHRKMEIVHDVMGGVR